MSMVDFKNLVGTGNGDKGNMLGKLLYFSLSNILVDKVALAELCQSMNIPYCGGKRLAVSDAFRSATGDIRERIVTKQAGQQQIYQVYCRDNDSTGGIISRELVKETLNQQTNQYLKLANISYDKGSMLFSSDNLIYDPDVDVGAYCHRAEELFELYQQCANRKQMESICTSYLYSLEATKLNFNGHLYFVPATHMEKVDIFEDFVELVSRANRNDKPLTANSIYIVDDAKQRNKMTQEFYAAVKKEIVEYQDRADYLIQSGSQSPAIMERWVMKIEALEQKKRHYEEVLRRELSGLDDEFSTLKFLSRELRVRAQSIRMKREKFRSVA